MDKITEIAKINEELSKIPEPTEQPKKKKVAIVGFASNWEKAPFENEDFEIWGLNELYKYFSKHPKATADRWFEIHSRNSPSKNNQEHMAWLKECPIPVYMWQHYDDIPKSVGFPKEEIVDFVYSKGLKLLTPEGEDIKNRYVTNSISWMFLLAWMEGFEEIHIYGVDLAQNEEYLYQRPNLEYYIGAAQATGIKVIMPDTCDLLKAGLLYGFETDNKFWLKIRQRKKELEVRKQQHVNEIKNAQNTINQLSAIVNQLDGAIGEISFYIKNWRV